MSKQWPGGIITKNQATPTGPYQNGTASGVWTLDQMNYWLKQGLWPIAGNALQLGLFAGGGSGYIPASNIQTITITTTGNATIFGGLTVNRSVYASGGSTTRGVFLGGEYG